MNRKASSLAQIVDYSAARAHAIRWLGDRHLLARPINASRYESRPPAAGVARAADDNAPDLGPRRPPSVPGSTMLARPDL